MLKTAEPLRTEQLYYIMNSLRFLVLVLKVFKTLTGPMEFVKAELFQNMVATLDQRLKITAYLLIQRISLESELNLVAREAMDMKKLAMKAEKNLQTFTSGMEDQEEKKAIQEAMRNITIKENI